MPASFTPLPPGEVSLMSARPAPDYAAAATPRASTPPRDRDVVPVRRAAGDGRWQLQPADQADFATRVVVRRPGDPAAFSGTLVAEWLNVSSGQDSAPDWTYLSEEILRRGHAWVGVSAQYVGVEGGGASVDHRARQPRAEGQRPGPLRGAAPPGRRLRLRHLHPGRRRSRGLVPDLDVECLLAIGESQSAVALTTYVNGVHPLGADCSTGS